MISTPHLRPFRNYATGTFELAQVTYSCDPPGAVIPQDSTNWTIPLFNGELVMADVHDFQATFNRYQPDVVITMSSKPPAFPEVAYEGEWLFRNFGGYDLLNMDAMGTIANEAIDALQQGKTVLIHCLHGQDRTGIIAAALIYAGYDHPDIDDRLEIIMTKARIKKESICETTRHRGRNIEQDFVTHGITVQAEISKYRFHRL